MNELILLFWGYLTILTFTYGWQGFKIVNLTEGQDELYRRLKKHEESKK